MTKTYPQLIGIASINLILLCASSFLKFLWFPWDHIARPLLIHSFTMVSHLQTGTSTHYMYKSSQTIFSHFILNVCYLHLLLWSFLILYEPHIHLNIHIFCDTCLVDMLDFTSPTLTYCWSYNYSIKSTFHFGRNPSIHIPLQLFLISTIQFWFNVYHFHLSVHSSGTTSLDIWTIWILAT